MGAHRPEPSHMNPYDVSNDAQSDREPVTVPQNIVARSDGDGRVIIYDEENRTAWISSTCAIPLQNAT